MWDGESRFQVVGTCVCRGPAIERSMMPSRNWTSLVWLEKREQGGGFSAWPSQPLERFCSLEQTVEKLLKKFRLFPFPLLTFHYRKILSIYIYKWRKYFPTSIFNSYQHMTILISFFALCTVFTQKHFWY